MTSILEGTVKRGTAKGLKDLNLPPVKLEQLIKNRYMVYWIFI